MKREANATFFLWTACLVVILHNGVTTPTYAATCVNQYIWTVDDADATLEEPTGVMQKWSTDGSMLDSFEFNAYRRFTGDISLSSDGKHIYGITYSDAPNGNWAGPDYHDILDSYSATGPANLNDLQPSDVALTGEFIGPDEDYRVEVNSVLSNTRLEASWFVDNWWNEVGYWWARGGAVVSENTMIIDRDYDSGQLLKIDLANGRTASDWINLHDADQSLIEAGAISNLAIDEQVADSAWGLGGDVVLLADGDVLVIAWNGLYDVASGHPEQTEMPILVRVHAITSDSVLDSDNTTATVIGTVEIPIRDGAEGTPFAYGGARAGDDVYIGTSNGYLLRLNDIPTDPGLEPISFDIVVDRPDASFGGAAGSDDFTNSNSTCINQDGGLANTGFDIESYGIASGCLVLLGVLIVNVYGRKPYKIKVD